MYGHDHIDVALKPAWLCGVWRPLLLAVVLFLTDAFFMGQGIIAFGMLLSVAFWLMPKTALFAMVGKNHLPSLRLAVVLLAAATATLLTINLNNRLAHHRAEMLVDAVEHFRSVNGRYPAYLEELTPGYLSQIPVAKYTFTFNEFIYRADGDEVSLTYVDVPPYGRPYYDFDHGQWRHVH